MKVFRPMQLLRMAAWIAAWVILGNGKVEAGPNLWTSIGPYGGSIKALAIDPQNPAILYATTTVGLFRSTDNGGSWTSANAGLSANASKLSFDPVNSNTVYASTTAGVFVITFP
jgi:hypothetical protein